MKFLIELFEWGYEGEFEQEFFAAPLSIEEVFDKLGSEQEFKYKKRYSDDYGIGYFVPFKVIRNKFLEWGFEPIEVDLQTDYITHLREFLLVDRDVDADTGEQVVTIELKEAAYVMPSRKCVVGESKIKREEPDENETIRF